MKYVSYIRNGLHSFGIWTKSRILDLPGAARAFGDTSMPDSLQEFLGDFAYYHRQAREIIDQVDPGRRPELFFPDGQVTFLPPLPDPRSFRLFYAFPEHTRSLSEHSDPGHLAERAKTPLYSYMHYSRILGPGEEMQPPAQTGQLDFELQIGVIVGRSGKDISRNEAPSYIAGYLILNDWTGRELETEEMKTGVGLSKSREFALSMGPALVTADQIPVDEESGKLNLSMSASVNGTPYSSGNTTDMGYSFVEMIAYASRNCLLRPGDVLSTGAVNSGSILSLGPDKYDWLVPGDTVQLQIEELGTLSNTIGASDSS